MSTTETPKAGDRVRHRKGGTYAVIGTAKVQTDTPLADYAEVVVYRSETDGLTWVRPVAEFTGRFSSLPSAPPAPEEEAVEQVDDTRLWWFLHILDACGSAGAPACDEPGEWIAAFCDDAEPVDTFNWATNLKLAGWSHNSDTDVTRTWITAEGRKWLAERRSAACDEAPRVIPGLHT